MPLVGEFEIKEDLIVFKGKPPMAATGEPEPTQQPVAAIGLLLCNQTVTNGRLRAHVQFADIIPTSVCELILGYDLKTKGMVSAGLGGSYSMFSIREWFPPNPVQTSGSWNNHLLAGDRGNLRHGVTYELGVRIDGSNVSLEVDGVQVGVATLLATPKQPLQVGIFCVGRGEISINQFHVESERPRAFIVMQFSSPYNEVYSHVIKDVCEELSVESLRADEIYGPGIIVKDVIDRIARSQVIIADISPTNPNVYFEVGYALALGKPIILLAQRLAPGVQLPFDLSAFRVLFYEDSIGGKPKLEEGLRKHLREILGKA
jgi:hypothetical protein